MDEEQTKMPGFHTRLKQAENWIEEHQKKSIRHTVYFGIVSVVTGLLVLHTFFGG